MSVETDDLGPGWDNVRPPQKGGGKRQNDGLSLFMKLEPNPEPYRVRLGCTPERFRKHRWAFRSLRQWPISPATDPSERDLDVAWKEGGFVPPTKYAAFVFDRNNGNRLRILEEGPEVFVPIANHAQATKVNPASSTKGWDWLILVTETEDANGKKSRQYAVTIDTTKGPTPFTDDETKALENPKFQRDQLKTKYFPKCTPEEIKDLWEQLPMSARKNEKNDGKKSASTAQPNEQKTAAKQSTTTETVAPKVQEKPVEKVAEKPVEKPAEKVAEKVAPEPPMDSNFLVDEDQSVPEENTDADSDGQPARLF